MNLKEIQTGLMDHVEEMFKELEALDKKIEALKEQRISLREKKDLFLDAALILYGIKPK